VYMCMYMCVCAYVYVYVCVCVYVYVYVFVCVYVYVCVCVCVYVRDIRLSVASQKTQKTISFAQKTFSFGASIHVSFASDMSLLRLTCLFCVTNDAKDHLFCVLYTTLHHMSLVHLSLMCLRLVYNLASYVFGTSLSHVSASCIQLGI